MQRSRLINILSPILIITIAVLVFLWLIKTAPTPVVGSDALDYFPVEGIKAIKQDYSPHVILYGQIVSPKNSTLSSSVSADVIATPKLAGDYVNAGDVIIQLDDKEVNLVLQQRLADVADLEAQIKALEERIKNDELSLQHEKELLALSEKSVSRESKLKSRQVGSEARHDEAKTSQEQQQLAVRNRELAIAQHPHTMEQLKSRLKRAQALAALAQVDVEKTQVHAPFAGRVAKMLVAVGERVNPQQVLAEVYDTNDLELRAQIPNRYMTMIYNTPALSNINAKASIHDHSIELQLERLAGEIASGQGGVDGYFRIISSSNARILTLGRTVKLTMMFPAQADLIPVPTAAMYGLDKIYLIKDDLLTPRTVKIVGPWRSKNNIQCLLIENKDIKTGEVILASKLPNIVSGLKVKVTQFIDIQTEDQKDE